MKVYCLVIIFFTVNLNLVYSQSKPEFKNEFSLGLITFEGNSFTIFNKLEPKVSLNMLYSKKMYKGSWNLNIGYGSNVINDKCINCADAPQGRGGLTEFYFGSGFRFLMFKPDRFKLNPFIGVNGYYSRMRYKINYTGGWSLNGFHDNIYNVGGGQIKVGALFYPLERLFFTYSASFRMGRGIKRSMYSNQPKQFINTSAYSILNLKVGYQF